MIREIILMIQRIFPLDKSDLLLDKVRLLIARDYAMVFSGQYEVSFIDNFVFNESTYIEIENQVKAGKKYLDIDFPIEKDLAKDNLEIYMITSKEQFYFLALFDPYELYEDAYILGLVEVKNDFISPGILVKQ